MKYITDEMVEAEMIKRGLPTDGDKLQDEEFVQQAVLKYYDVEITNDYTQKQTIMFTLNQQQMAMRYLLLRMMIEIYA